MDEPIAIQYLMDLTSYDMQCTLKFLRGSQLKLNCFGLPVRIRGIMSIRFLGNMFVVSYMMAVWSFDLETGCWTKITAKGEVPVQSLFQAIIMTLSLSSSL